MSFLKKYQKIVFFLIVAFLFIGFGLFYNQNRETLAQEELIWQCGEEIPIGEAIDETLAFALAILTQSQIVVSSSLAQANAAGELAELPEQCRAENCNTGCIITSSDVEANTCPDPCPSQTESRCGDIGEPCPPGEDCTDFCVSLGECAYCWDEEICEPCTITETTCEVLHCSGEACPFGEISNKVSQIQNYYSRISAANAEIGRLIIEDRPPILVKLNEARVALSNCATPASGYTPEEAIQLPQTVFSCEEVNYLRILPDVQDCDPDNVDYHPGNFICCRPTTP